MATARPGITRADTTHAGTAQNRPARTVNRRGDGARLRQEILDAAAALLSETTSGAAVTMRGIAARAGIAAPSIYPHFVNRDAILEAVIADTFKELTRALTSGIDPGAQPAERLEGICRSYLTFATDLPGRYRLLFERSGANISSDRRSYSEGLTAFELLRRAVEDCVAEGSSSSVDAATDSALLWTALHGLVTLIPATPGFPWPSSAVLLHRLVTDLTHLVDVAAVGPQP